MKKFSLLALHFLMPLVAFPQNAAMADRMRSDGKIYVVIAVIAVVFLCLLAFLIYLERKLNRLEKRVRNKEGAAV